MIAVVNVAVSNMLGGVSMVGFDKNYLRTSAYPKQIISRNDMSIEERSFYDSVLKVLAPAIDIENIVVEQRNGDYRTMVYNDWDNDFLRYHFGSDGFWASVRMYKPLMTAYEDNPLFDAQANKRQLHWRASVSSSEISKLGEVMIASCKGFFGEFDAKFADKPNKSMVDKLTAAIAKLERASLEVHELLSGKEYEFVVPSDVTLAGCEHHEASKKVTDGAVLRCAHDKGNQYDDQAIGVYDANDSLVGYLPAKSRAKKEAFSVISEGRLPLAVVTQDGTNGGTRIKRKKIHVALICIN